MGYQQLDRTNTVKDFPDIVGWYYRLRHHIDGWKGPYSEYMYAMRACNDIISVLNKHKEAMGTVEAEFIFVDVNKAFSMKIQTEEADENLD